MCKRLLALMLALVMVAALLPATVFTAAASGDTEPLTDEYTTDGSPSPNDEQPPEDQHEDGDPASGDPSEAPGQDEPVDTGEDGQDSDIQENHFENLTGPEIIGMFAQQPEEVRALYSGITEVEWDTISGILSDDEKAVLNDLLTEAGCIAAPQDTDDPTMDGDAPDGSDMGIAPITLDANDEAFIGNLQ